MRQRKKAEMYPLVEKWQQGGQSRLQFSKEHGLKSYIFNYWVKRYKKEQDLNPESDANNKFVPLEIQGSPLSQMELSYPNGVSLQINGQISSKYLAELIKLGTHV